MLPLVRFEIWNQKTTFYLLSQIISHWWTLPASVTCMSQVGKVPEWVDFTCAFVDCVAACVLSHEAAEWPVLGILLSLWGHPPTPSWWPCADASMKPLHSLTLLSPSSHSLARQKPTIVLMHGVANSQTHACVHMHNISRWIPNSKYIYIKTQVYI